MTMTQKQKYRKTERQGDEITKDRKRNRGKDKLSAI